MADLVQVGDIKPFEDEVKSIFQFGMIADVQYADKDDGTNFSRTRIRRYRQSVGILEQAIETWNRETPNMAFLLQLGDVIDGSNKTLTPPKPLDVKYGCANQSYSALDFILKKFSNVNTPLILHAVGNHEMYNFSISRLREVHTTNPFQGYHHLKSIGRLGIAKTSKANAKTNTNTNTNTDASKSGGPQLSSDAPGVASSIISQESGEAKQTTLNEGHKLRVRPVEDWYLADDWPVLDLVNAGVDVAKLDPQYPAFPPTYSPTEGQYVIREAPCDYYSFSPAPNWRFILLNSYELTSIHGTVSANSNTVQRCPELAQLTGALLELQKTNQAAALAILSQHNPNVTAGRDDWSAGLSSEKRRYLPYNGALGEAQLVWLAQQLESARNVGERVIIASHIPVFSRYAEYETLLWDASEALALLHKYSGTVVAYFAGHDHDGAYEVDGKGVYHITPPAPIECGLGETAFSYVTVTEDSLLIKGFGKCPSFNLPLPPRAPPSKPKSSGGSSEDLIPMPDKTTPHMTPELTSRPQSRHAATLPVVAPLVYDYLVETSKCPKERPDE